MSNLPPGWRAKQDAKGRTYYYNKATKESTWEMPTVASEPVVEAAAADSGDSDLPEGWKAKQDDKGRTYYYHRATRETTWTRPQKEDRQAEKAAASSRKASKKEPVEEVAKKSAKSSSKDASKREGLPPGWRSKQDSKGRTYYYHKATQESSWTPPEWPEDAAAEEGQDPAPAKKASPKIQLPAPRKLPKQQEQDEEEAEEEDEAKPRSQLPPPRSASGPPPRKLDSPPPRQQASSRWQPEEDEEPEMPSAAGEEESWDNHGEDALMPAPDEEQAWVDEEDPLDYTKPEKRRGDVFGKSIWEGPLVDGETNSEFYYVLLAQKLAWFADKSSKDPEGALKLTGDYAVYRNWDYGDYAFEVGGHVAICPDVETWQGWMRAIRSVLRELGSMDGLFAEDDDPGLLPSPSTGPPPRRGTIVAPQSDDEDSESALLLDGEPGKKQKVPGSIVEGWMKKPGSTGKHWKRRYFVLMPDRLMYFKKFSDASSAGHVPLVDNGASCDLYPSEGRPLLFGLCENRDPGTRVYTMEPATKEHRNKWVKRIRSTIAKLPRANRVSDSVYEGWLEKKGGTFGGKLQMRYIVLTWDSMQWYKHRLDAPKSMANQISISTQSTIEEDAQQIGKFTIVENRRSKKKYVFQARSNRERDTWLDHIRQVIRGERESKAESGPALADDDDEDVVAKMRERRKMAQQANMTKGRQERDLMIQRLAAAKQRLKEKREADAKGSQSKESGSDSDSD